MIFFYPKKASVHESLFRAACLCTIVRVDCAAVSPYIAVAADMDEFIKEYIAEANKEIEQFNRQLELQGQPDLFDPW